MSRAQNEMPGLNETRLTAWLTLVAIENLVVINMIDPPFNLQDDCSSSKTSSSDFLQALRAFLSRNQIDFITSFRIRLEPTSDNNWTLLVMGETIGSDWNAFNQVELGLAWSNLPTPPVDLAAHERAAARASIASGSSSVSLPVGDMQVESNYLEDELTQMPYSQLDDNLNDPLTTFDSIFPSTCGFSPSSIPNILSRSSFIGADEAHRLASPLLDHMDPIVVDSQSPLTMPFAVDHHVDDSLWVNYSTRTSPIFDFGREIDTSSPAASGSIGGLFITHRNASSRCREARPQHKPTKRHNHRHKRKTNMISSDDTSELMVKSLSRNVLCEDFYSLLVSGLPRWTREGLWHEMPQKLTGPNLSTTKSTPSPSSSSKLERAYLAVCQLSSRMGDDLIRNRMALIQLHLEYMETQQVRRGTLASDRIESSVGRGDASHVIDRILENIHDGWRALDQRRRAELRAKFHERKKFGKRWSQLANALGPGILLICSTKLSNAIRSTTVTAKMLEAVIERVKVLDPDTVRIIGVVSPLAGCLLKNEGFNQFEVAEILRQLQCCSARLTRV